MREIVLRGIDVFIGYDKLTCPNCVAIVRMEYD